MESNGSKKKPYSGPVYSKGTKYQDSKENMGPPAGPTSGDGKCPDPLGYGTRPP